MTHSPTTEKHLELYNFLKNEIMKEILNLWENDFRNFEIEVKVDLYDKNEYEINLILNDEIKIFVDYNYAEDNPLKTERICYRKLIITENTFDKRKNKNLIEFYLNEDDLIRLEKTNFADNCSKVFNILYENIELLKNKRIILSNTSDKQKDLKETISDYIEIIKKLENDHVLNIEINPLINMFDIPELELHDLIDEENDSNE